jgi:plasmid stability protein
MAEVKQFKLNLPADVKDWLKAEAAKNLRSQGSEIVACLRKRMERTETQTQ